MPYFDVVAPMVYPSHYPKNFLGLGNPNDYPYKVVHYAMQFGVNRLLSSTTRMQGFLHTRIGTSTSALYNKPTYTADKLRTLIHNFDYGGDYDAADVRATDSGELRCRGDVMDDLGTKQPLYQSRPQGTGYPRSTRITV